MPWNLAEELHELEQRSLRRSLRSLDSPQGPVVQLNGREVINFSSNDYLGFASSDVLKNAMMEGIARYGAGSGASRLVCGGLAPHRELEEALAAFKGAEAALTFSSGFAVALGVIPALVGKDDVIVMDKLCHASLVDAARLSGATIRVFPHNHLEKLERLLQSNEGRRTLVITESIFSMDGDAALLKEIVELKDQHGAWLMLDEAHAVGVLGPQGRGLAAALGLEQRIELQMGTLSKALGLSGGYLAASRTVIDLLINKARSFIYSTAPSPAVAHAASAALQLCMSAEGEARRAQLQANLAVLIRRGRREESMEEVGNNTDSSRRLLQAAAAAAIVPIIIGDESAAMQLSAQLLEEGYLIPAIRYPTVARGTARLRVTLSAAHEAAQVEGIVQSLQYA